MGPAVHLRQLYGATALSQLPDPLTSPEAQGLGDITPQRASQTTWTFPATNRFVVQAGVGTMFYTWGNSERPGNPTHDLVRVTEQCTAGCAVNGNIPGLNYRSMVWNVNYAGAVNWQGSASYVTGAHSLKVGYQGTWDQSDTNAFTNSTGLAYRVNNGVPNQLTMTINPFSVKNREAHYALYAQEQWTRKRLTLQGALRYDHAWSWFPTQQEGPARFLPVPLVFPETSGVTGYNDLSPRVAAIFDLFGTGKTSVKVNLGKYLQNASTIGNYSGTNPASRTAGASVTRTWTDANGNFAPDCNLLNLGSQDLRAGGGDFCGAVSNSNFGTGAISNTYDPAVLSGWGVRTADWNFGASVQHQVLPRTSVEVGYFVRWFQNFYVTDNLSVTAANYGAFSVTAPADSRLPGGGGTVVSGLYDVNAAQFGQVNNFITSAKNYGDQYSHWDGLEINVNARPKSGLTFQGGTSTGQSVTDNCAIRTQLPETALLNPYCHIASGFLTQFRGLASYTLPKVDVQLSVVFQSKPGPQLAANYTVPNAAVVPSLGRSLSGNAPNVTVNLIPPGTLYGDRINQLDLKLGKILKFGRTRTSISLDVYNALNSDVILIYNNTFIQNGSWLAPQSVISGRLARISAQFDF